MLPFKLNGEIYYQSLFDVPIVNDMNSSFSALNMLEGFVTDTLVNEGTGENYGLELSVMKNFTGNYFLLGKWNLLRIKIHRRRWS